MFTEGYVNVKNLSKGTGELLEHSMIDSTIYYYLQVCKCLLNRHQEETGKFLSRRAFLAYVSREENNAALTLALKSSASMLEFKFCCSWMGEFLGAQGSAAYFVLGKNFIKTKQLS